MLRLKFLVRGLQGRPKYESEAVFVSAPSLSASAVLNFHPSFALPGDGTSLLPPTWGCKCSVGHVTC